MLEQNTTHLQNTKWLATSPVLKKMKKNTSQHLHWMMIIWMEEPDPNKHLCIHEHSKPHDLCPYPCPYSLDQLHLAPEYTPTPQCMDLSDIFDFPNVITIPATTIYLIWKMFSNFKYRQLFT